MKKYKNIDIIMPVHNTPIAYLKDALDSCLNQSYQPKNIIVVDDYSGQDYSYITKISPKIKLIKTPKNIGPAGARNFGINSQHCKSELISFLDSDDIMDANKLAYTILEFNKNPNIGMTCGNYRILVNRKRLMKPFYKHAPKINRESLMRQNYVASGSTTVRRDVLIEVGGFDERFWIAEDYNCWLKISENYKIGYINKVLYYYSVIPKGDSLTQRDDIQLNHLKNIEIIRSESKVRVQQNGGEHDNA